MEEIMKFEVKFIHKYLKMKSNMKNILTLVLFVFLVTSCNSENKFDITNVDVNLSNKIERVEPPNWWIDMKTKDLQLRDPMYFRISFLFPL